MRRPIDVEDRTEWANHRQGSGELYFLVLRLRVLLSQQVVKLRLPSLSQEVAVDRIARCRVETRLCSQFVV